MTAVAISPGRGLGSFILGSSIFDILTEIRSNHTLYPSTTLTYDPTTPLSSPIILTLDMNGLRLRFDGADQRLRLIEVISFSKSRHLSYNGSELARAGQAPTFRFIYNKLFGPTYPGEYLADQGVYILSYPGISFSFPVDGAQWKDDVDFVSMLSASTAQSASSMAIFNGPSWAESRNHLFTKAPTNSRNPNVTSHAAKQSPANDEIELVRVIAGEGKIDLIRRHNSPFSILLGSTTPQDLVMELGPPTTIYHKNDHRLSIHKASSAGGVGIAIGGGEDLDAIETDNTQSDNGESEDDDEEDMDPKATDYFYNYYSHGLDIYISTANTEHVATKIILHGNVPGSLGFNRYRRSRWEITFPDECGTTGEDGTQFLSSSPGQAEAGSLPLGGFDFGQDVQPTSSSGPTTTEDIESASQGTLNSEMQFDDIYIRLKERFGTIQKPMLLNRGSDSPSSSVELLGGWDEGDSGLKGASGALAAEEAFGNTELYGFPGLIFEVLRNRAVSALTVF